MLASEPLFKFIISSLEFMNLFGLLGIFGVFPVMQNVSCLLCVCTDFVSDLGCPVLLFS